RGPEARAELTSRGAWLQLKGLVEKEGTMSRKALGTILGCPSAGWRLLLSCLMRRPMPEVVLRSRPKRRACCGALRSGPDVGCDRLSGSSGSTAGNDLRNCGNGEWARTSLLKQQAAPTVCGSWQTVRPSLSRCPTLTLSHSEFPLWLGAR